MINRQFLSVCIAIVSSLFLTACGGSGGSDVSIPTPTKPVVIMAFGDSLTAGYGNSTSGTYFQFVTPGNTWVQLLANKIKADGVDSKVSVVVLNASIGGEFTNGASRRLPGLLAKYKPTHVLLGHGTNDANSAYDLGGISSRMAGMASTVNASGAKAFILGYGFQRGGEAHSVLYAQALKNAASNGGATYIDITADTLFKKQFYNPDLIHLNDNAQALMLNRVVEKLYPALN